MVLDLGWKSWLRQKLAGLVAPPPKRFESLADHVEALKNSPEFEAFVELRTIEAQGLAALEAGQPRAAAETFRRQEALARRMVGRVLLRDTLEPACAGLLVARALEKAGEPFADVEEAARRDAVLRASKATSRVAHRLHDQGREHARAGRLLAARALIEAAIALYTPWKEQDPLKMDVLRMDLVNVLRRLGELAEVERQLRVALAERERRGDPLRSAARDDLAYHCKTQGRWDEALALYRQSLAETIAAAELAKDEETKADELGSISVERMRVAEALHHLGQKAEAFTELDRVEAEIAAQEGPESPAIPTALRLRGELLRADGQGDEARTLFDRAQAIMAKYQR